MHNPGPNLQSTGPQKFASPTAEPLYPHGLFVIAPQVFLESYVLQPRHALSERTLLVRLPEEFCIIESRPQHTLVAMPNQALRIAICIQHGQKVWQQLACGIFQRKIFLMIAHYGDQHFFRQLEVLSIKTAQNY